MIHKGFATLLQRLLKEYFAADIDRSNCLHEEEEERSIYFDLNLYFLVDKHNKQYYVSESKIIASKFVCSIMYTESQKYFHSVYLYEEIVSHLSFEIMRIFIRFSCQSLSEEVQTNRRYKFSKVIGGKALRID